MPETPLQRELRIKTGILSRANKDLIEYRKELIDFTEKLEKVKASGSTDFQINQATLALDETQRMIPDCTEKLENIIKDMEDYIEEHKADEISSSEAFSKAKELLDSCKKTLE